MQGKKNRRPRGRPPVEQMNPALLSGDDHDLREQAQKALGKRLRDARSRIFIYASDAAAALGESVPTYSAYERGARGFSRDLAEHFAKSFGVSFDWLWTNKGSMEPSQPLVEAPPERRPAIFVASGNPLEAHFDVRVGGDEDVKLAEATEDKIFDLPARRKSAGYVAELASPKRFGGRPYRRVRVGDELLALAGFVHFPSDMLSCEQVFAHRVEDKGLFDRGVICLIDPARTDIAEGGVFLFKKGDRLQLFYCVRPDPVENIFSDADDGDASFKIFTSRVRPAASFKAEEIPTQHILGKLAATIALFTQEDHDSFFNMLSKT